MAHGFRFSRHNRQPILRNLVLQRPRLFCISRVPVFFRNLSYFREEASFRCVKEHFLRDARFITPISRRNQHFCAFVYVSANSPIVSKSILRYARLVALISTRASCEKVFIFSSYFLRRFPPIMFFCRISQQNRKVA